MKLENINGTNLKVLNEENLPEIIINAESGEEHSPVLESSRPHKIGMNGMIEDTFIANI